MNADGVGASTVLLPAGPWHLVLDFLCERFTHVARSEWLGRFARGEVEDMQGQQLRADAVFQAHTKVQYFRSVADEPKIPFEETVLFRDEHLVVADKPHFLPVVPSGRFVRETLLARLKKRLGIATLAPLHRIDLDTAGVVAFSVQVQTRAAYQNLFRDRLVFKSYEAIARVNPALQFPMQRESRIEPAPHFMQMRERERSSGMALNATFNATTRIDLLERLSDGYGRFELKPSSGVRHQLRVHMMAVGMPIFGDRIYPDLYPEPSQPDYSTRLRLLARELSFSDPVTGIARRFVSRLRLEH